MRFSEAPNLVQSKVLDIIDVEGGYVDNPDDAGGKTKYGITEEVARQYGYSGDMKWLPVALAKEIYIGGYWVKPKYSAIAERSDMIATELFECGVNCGTGLHSRNLQLLLNCLNRGERDYSDITPDGKIGPQTLGALEAYLGKRKLEGEKVLFNLLNCLQGAHYVNITENRERNETFLYGWARNRLEFCEF